MHYLRQLNTSTRVLIAEISFLVLAASLLTVLHFPKFLPTNVYLFLHITGAVLFIGNVVVTGVWMVWAERTKDTRVIAFATRAVSWADAFFTGPGVVLLLLSGLLMAPNCDECTQGFATHWIIAGLALFGISGALWLVLLIYQNTLLKSLSSNPSKFYKTLHRWYFVGILNTVIPLVILAIMATKPAF
ncbi:MAG TPA: DUF2269 family protein [Candidatus Saccharimonadales bacterium]|nr:DUF2269 family protein [Candidatus Saccharimonadales bacterium]